MWARRVEPGSWDDRNHREKQHHWVWDRGWDLVAEDVSWL